LIEIINKQLLLQLVGYLCYWQMGFNSVFKGLINNLTRSLQIHTSVLGCFPLKRSKNDQVFSVR